jgi:hypothetical protein
VEVKFMAAARRGAPTLLTGMGLAKENCFSIRGGSEEKISFLHYGKAFNKQKRRMKTIPTIRVEALRARRAVLKSG